MKKLLLTLAAVVGLGFAATAEEVTIATTEANKWTAAGDGFTTTVDGFTLTTAKADSGTDLITPDKTALRVYQGSTFTIKAPEGMVMTKVAMTEVHNKASELSHVSFSAGWTAYGNLSTSQKAEEFGATSDGLAEITLSAAKQIRISQVVITYKGALSGDQKPADLSFDKTSVTIVKGEEFTAPKLNNPNNLAVVWESSKEDVATVDNKGVVTVVGLGSTTISVKSEATAQFGAGYASYTLTVKKPIVTETVTLATAMSDGKYAIYTPQGVAKNYTGSNTTYGYLYLEAVTAENNEFTVNVEYLIEFTATDKGYTMKDSKGVYLGMDASHFGSFNFYSDPDAEGSNCYWTVTFEGNDVKIENTGRAGAFISYKKYNNDWEIATTDNADQPLVQLYKVKDSSAITEIEAAENAPVEYFNLQGVRVANPENGLYIRRQGNKVTKVIVR